MKGEKGGRKGERRGKKKRGRGRDRSKKGGDRRREEIPPTPYPQRVDQLTEML